jgi:endonuclease/exonuclease/phosphatase family metal-dependent hydrolase
MGILPSSIFALAAVTVATWNGEWFPSGRAEHRAAPEVEARTIRRAGAMLRGAFAAADPAGTNDIVLCLNEIRDRRSAEELAKAIGRDDLKIAMISAYRRRDRFDQQQDVIMTTLPVVSASWSRWRNAKDNTPPRGYVYAELAMSPSVTSRVYAVHLKSNYGQTTREAAVANRAKRANAISQIVGQERAVRGRFAAPVVIAGDFNADAWKAEFRGEPAFMLLSDAGFSNVLALVPEDDRETYPGKGRWRGSVLDYIFLRGLSVAGEPRVVSSQGVSDHNPVVAVLDLSMWENGTARKALRP